MNSKASFTNTVNVIVFVSGPFDIFDEQIDRQKEFATHFAHQSVHHTMLNFDGNFNTRGEDYVTCRQTLTSTWLRGKCLTCLCSIHG